VLTRARGHDLMWTRGAGTAGDTRQLTRARGAGPMPWERVRRTLRVCFVSSGPSYGGRMPVSRRQLLAIAALGASAGCSPTEGRAAQRTSGTEHTNRIIRTAAARAGYALPVLGPQLVGLDRPGPDAIACAVGRGARRVNGGLVAGTGNLSARQQFCRSACRHLRRHAQAVSVARHAATVAAPRADVPGAANRQGRAGTTVRRALPGPHTQVGEQ
jgi:hypothetical protein